MSEELETQETIPESVEPTPEEGTGPSEPVELPEEYKPYSMIPWDQIPEEQREAVLQGVKKFHGGMTKGQQEFAKMKGQMAELQKKSEMLDQLVAEPWVREAWELHKSGKPLVKEPEKSVNLSDHLDAEAAKAIESMVSKAIEAKFGQLNSQITNLGQEQANARASRELEELTKKAAENGWPDPKDKLDIMAQIVASGRANTVEDAYRVATYEDVPAMVKEKTRTSLMAELKSKAAKSVAPSMGSSGNGKVSVYTGRDSVLKAFRDAKLELGI